MSIFLNSLLSSSGDNVVLVMATVSEPVFSSALWSTTLPLRSSMMSFCAAQRRELKYEYSVAADLRELQGLVLL